MHALVITTPPLYLHVADSRYEYVDEIPVAQCFEGGTYTHV